MGLIGDQGVVSGQEGLSGGSWVGSVSPKICRSICHFLTMTLEKPPRLSRSELSL